MAIRGVKPKPPAYLAVVKGQPVPDGQEDVGAQVEPGYDNGLEPPRKLGGRQLELWNEYVRKASWLTHFDRPRALMWVHLQKEFEGKPTKMVAGKIAQLRALGSELGLDPASRTRIGAEVQKPAALRDPAEKFFGR